MASIVLDPSRIQPSLRMRYIATICLGSFLLFLVQPLVARLALPRLGGAPAVWNSAMLVYQALLLAGYAYAHASARLAVRRQATLHLVLFAAAAITLPIGLGVANPPADGNPVFWVPWLLVTAIGPLFFVVAAQAPMMQRWFSVSGGGDPYPLYAASNLGSFAGLICYPLLVEPLLPLLAQRWMWSALYLALMLCVAACALSLPRHAGTISPAASPSGPAIGWRRRLYWIALASVPSGLMLSTTTHLTTDIMAMPLLWVIPLGLYLLSFSIAFAERRTAADIIGNIAPYVVLFAGAFAFADGFRAPLLAALLGLALLLAVAVACHAEMYRTRPEPARLTEFYLLMSVGGVIGGLFCALAAPLIFDWAYEHPLLILGAALLVPAGTVLPPVAALWQSDSAPRLGRWLPVLAIGLALLAGNRLGWDLPPGYVYIVALVLLAMAVVLMPRRIGFAVALGAVMLVNGGWETLDLSASGHRTRSYFGIYVVGDTDGGKARILTHGTTVHGVQNREPGRALIPTTYYAAPSGIGQAMRALPLLAGPHASVGVVGLGAGTLACYARPGQQWRFYEIDPVIVTIARNPARFTFLSKCTPGAPVEIGDARLTLADAAPASFDLLAIDAFSSDVVPMHLLTAEAFQVYARTLRPGGVLMVHISNRFIDLEPVLAGAAAKLGWQAAVRQYRVDDRGRTLRYSSSLWVALSRDPARIAALRQGGAVHGQPWRDLKPRSNFAPWTDDFASILPLIKTDR